MVDLTNHRRVAATLLKCGEHRVWFDPKMTEDIAYAVTREDIRKLIKSNYIQVRQKKGTSRGRARFAQAQRKKGKRKGQGSRKGGKYARFPKKRRWIATIRPVRAQLRELRDQNIINRNIYRKFYLYAKGGMFRNKGHLMAHLKAENLLESNPQTLKSIKSKEKK